MRKLLSTLGLMTIAVSLYAVDPVWDYRAYNPFTYRRDVTVSTPTIVAVSTRSAVPIDAIDGSFKESFDATISVVSEQVVMSIQQTGGGDLTMYFSNGISNFDCTPSSTIVLTHGTESSPQINYVYIDSTTKTMTVNTSGWIMGENNRIAFFLIQSTQGISDAGGTIINQNWNDHVMGANERGDFLHISEKLRLLGASYFSGISGNGDTGYLTNASGQTDFKSTAGIVYQKHRHTFPAFNTSTGSTMHVKNWFEDSFHALTNLFDITADSGGNTITNNKYFNLIFWGVQNKSGQHQTVMVNLPSGFYNTRGNAEEDASGYNDFTIPREFGIDSSVGFLIVKITIRMGDPWTHVSEVDLRGTTPQIAAGGASSSIKDFADNEFSIFDNLDDTKVMEFDVGSLVSSNNTRTYKAPNADGTLPLLELSQTWTANQTFSDDTKMIFGDNGEGEIYSDGNFFKIKSVDASIFLIPSPNLAVAIRDSGNSQSVFGYSEINSLIFTNLPFDFNGQDIIDLGDIQSAGRITTSSITVSSITIDNTNLVTNLNADLLDGKHTGTSGNTVPLLDGTNTWSAVNTYSVGIKLLDDDYLDFGTGASGLGDVRLTHDGTDLILKINGGGSKVFDHFRVKDADVVFENEVEGTKQSFVCSDATGANMSGFSTLWILCGEVRATVSRGWVMARAGSMVGISIGYDITGTDVQNTLTMQFQKNGSGAWNNDISDTVSNNKKEQFTQARGIDTFVAGDYISCKFSSGGFGLGTIDIENIMVTLEVYYND